MKMICVLAISLFFTACGSSKTDNCGCCSDCDRTDLKHIEEKCGCCTGCGTGGCQEVPK